MGSVVWALELTSFTFKPPLLLFSHGVQLRVTPWTAARQHKTVCECYIVYFLLK